MSTVARTRGTVLRPVAMAALAASALGMAGCAHYETTRPYQPAAGVQTNAPGVQVRNLMIVSSDGKASLAGGLVAAADDSLESVTGTALKADGSAGDKLNVQVDPVKLPAASGVNLSQSTSSVEGVTPGGMTQLTLNFAKAGAVQLTVPVVDAKTTDISTLAPQAAASNAG